MASGSSFPGKEVPMISNNDTIKWLNIRVPSTSIIQPSPHQLHTPPINDASSMCIVRDHDDHSTTYFIWRINKTRPNVLEIVQFGSFPEFQRVGLRIEFMSALCPFASVCKNESESASMMPYMLYTLSADGIAYLIRLNNFNNYGSCSVFPTSDVVELNTRSYGDGTITAIAATTGFFVIGKEDGSYSCFRLGSLDSTSPGFVHELSEDPIIGFLSWFAESYPITAVKDLVCLEILGRTHLFVLHSSGDFEVWNLLSCTRLYNGYLNGAMPEGTTFMRLWSGEFNNDFCMLPLALLHKPYPEVDGEMISIYALYFCPRGMNDCRSEPSETDISVEEGALIDVRLSSDKIWILKKDRLVLHSLSGPCMIRENLDIIVGEHEQCFGLQESVVAEQLFQSSEHDADNLFRLAHSLYPSAKDQIATHVSSIFMRRLYLPGVFHNSVLQATLRDHNKHFTNSEFHSLSADGIRKEIMSLMKHQGASRSPHSLLYWWKNFYSCYLYHWCHENAPCALLLDSSTGTIGLIRKSSISLLRSLEDIEILSFGSDGLGEMASGSIALSGYIAQEEMLFEVLQCTSILSQQLGNGAPDFVCESFFSEPSPEDIVGRLVKVLEAGYTSSIRGLHLSEPSIDSAWEDKRRDHNTHKRFSVNMLLSLRGLCRKAKTWGNIITIIKLYIDSLVVQKIDHNSDCEAGFDVRTCITVQVTSQVAKVMFESAVDILLLLNYMVKLGGQINMHPDDVSRIQLELFPLLQKIITEWHIIHFLGTTPCESRAIEDSDSSANGRSWNEKQGKCDFTLAFLLILDQQRSFQGQDGVNLRRLPNPSSLSAPLRKFSSWIVWGTSEDGSSSFSARSTILALILLKHGQFDAVEHLLSTVNQNLLKEITLQEEDANDDFSTQKPDSLMDIEKLENEFVLTSAEHVLSKENIEWTFTGIERTPSNLIDLLVQSNLYDMAFTVILKFYSGSALKRELERVFTAMSRKCCPSRNDTKKHGLLLTSKDEVASAAQHSKRKDQMDALKQYIEKYKSFHPRLPVIVAETLLCADNLIELPLWLVEMFKTTQDTSDMAGSESNPPSLFQLYVDYGRYAEATNLLLRCIEAFTSLGPAGTIHMEETSAGWFPYTTIERFWSKLMS